MNTDTTNDSGRVFWFTGLPGAGKTTIATAFYQRLRRQQSNVVFLDGDELREIYGEKESYDINSRQSIAFRNARLCLSLANQGLDIICATVSMFKEVYQWNRSHILRYLEIYIRVPFDVLLVRDKKGLYSSACQGTQKNVLGFDISVDKPESPDIIIDNDGGETVETIVDRLSQKFIAVDELHDTN